MLNFQSMIKSPGRYHIYGACHADLILGCGIAVSYVQVGDRVRVDARHFDVATINYLDLMAVKHGLSIIQNNAPYTIHTNNRYVSMVILHADSWRRQGIIKDKAYSTEVQEILTTMEPLGSGQIDLSVRKYARDDMMTHLLKYCRHLYQQAQMEMISRRSTVLPHDFFKTEMWDLKELAGSIIWKSPLSIAEFEKRMAKSRAGNQTFADTKTNYLKLVQ